jgi:hypothetical protein
MRTQLQLRVALLGVIVALARIELPAQSSSTEHGAGPGRPERRSAIARTADGRPDLSGIWDYATTTPLERLKEFVGKSFTEQELAAIAKAGEDRADNFVSRVGGVGSYNREWYFWGAPINRPSLITDPPDGRLPPAAVGASTPRPQGRPAGPEDFTPGDRCIAMSGPPFRPGAYNNNVGLFLTRDHLVIHNEMIHSARIVPLDGRSHLGVPQWLGNSRGRWEGDTLVVETVKFRSDPRGDVNGAVRGKRVIERFQPLDSETIEYTATVDDPSNWTKAWTMSFPLRRTKQAFYEYACHEGNKAMANMLGVARAEEANEKAR